MPHRTKVGAELHETPNLEPIAIIGMGCRFPNDLAAESDIETPGEFWNFLQKNGDAFRMFPEDRFRVDSWYHPTVGRPGSFYTRGGCFLRDDVRNFDHTFFRISPQEALSLDPAQRKLLETVYEAFESSGTPLAKISGSQTGCFIGNFNYDHQLMQFRDAEYPQPYGMTGGGVALLSNRINYIFDLHGPSMTLDTACSGSLYALHLACASIRAGECSAAVVGGSNLILTPECQLFSAALGAVSPTSRCHTFDAAADGYARADGIGVLFIRRLTDAIRNRDPIRAVIRGTSINANGRTGGITHPDPSGQERAIRRAYEIAGLDVNQTSYLECHGTGTKAGDPLEVEAIGRVFGPHRSPEKPLWIGSVKSNLGHSESSSGIAGIMKVVLALEHGVIPPMARIQRLNPDLDLRGDALRIVQESIPWPISPVRRASVNSFGYGGANAHAILEGGEVLAPRCDEFKTFSQEDYERHNTAKRTLISASMLNGSQCCSISIRHPIKKNPPVSPHIEIKREWFLLPFSAHNYLSLEKNIEAISSRATDWNLVDLAYTLGCRRSMLAARSFVIADRSQSGKGDWTANSLVLEQPRSFKRPILGFVLTGQGAQWPQMGFDLMQNFAVYLRSIRLMDQILQSLGEDAPSWSIETELLLPTHQSRVHEAWLSQPLVTAVQIALVDLLGSWGVRPKICIGHSSGEIAAAYTAGQLSVAEAIVVAYARGQIIMQNKHAGAMLAVDIENDALTSFLNRYPLVEPSCFNSPRSKTLSGDRDQILALGAELQDHGYFTRLLETGGNAYHSTHMKPLGSKYEACLLRMLSNLPPNEITNRLSERCLFASSVTGELSTMALNNIQYWRLNLESPVLFDSALTALVESSKVTHLIELGPHPALRGPIRQIGQAMSSCEFPKHLPTQIRKHNGAESILRTVGQLFKDGYDLDWKQVNAVAMLDKAKLVPAAPARVIVDLPKYQWQYTESLYHENRWTHEWRLRPHSRHDLLGSRLPGGNDNEPMWRNILNHERLPWLKDHKVGSDVILPAAAHIAMAIEALSQTLETRGFTRRSIAQFECLNIHIDKALIIPHGGVEVLFSLRQSRDADLQFEYTLTSVTKGESRFIFTEHGYGTVSAMHAADDGYVKPTSPVAHLVKKLPSQWYHRLARVGLSYGPTFQCLTHLETSAQAHLAKCNLNLIPNTSIVEESTYVMHPAALDAVIQAAIISAHGGVQYDCTAPLLPVSIGSLKLSTMLANFTSSIATAWSIPAQKSYRSNALLVSSGTKLLSMNDLHLIRIEAIMQPVGDSQPFARIIWKPDIDLLTSSKWYQIYKPFSENISTERLDELAFHMMQQFRANNPTTFKEGSRSPHLQRLLQYMCEKTDAAPEEKNRSISERQSIINTLQDELLASNRAETRLMSHIYECFPAIYRGELTGIQAATQHNHLGEIYKQMKLFTKGSQVIGAVLQLISHKQPMLDILEIGGGTGSATREVLRELRCHQGYNGYQSYLFTDIAPSFLAEGRTEFGCYSNVDFAKYDMEVPPHEQGITDTYDVIIASNAIHATADVHRTLQNVRLLLKPHGKLVLFEIVRPAMAWGLMLGTFSDFWKGDNDPNYPRTGGPFLTLDQWQQAFVNCGFSGFELNLTHSLNDCSAVLVTTVSHPKIPRPLRSEITIIYSTIGPFVLRLDDFLRNRGHCPKLVPFDHIGNLEKKRVISLMEIDRPIFSTISEAEWRAFQMILKAESCLWVTKGGLLDGISPECAMIGGLLAAAHREDSSRRFISLDLEPDGRWGEQLENIELLEEHALSYRRGDDFEYRSQSGVLHVSRLINDSGLNANVLERENTDRSIQMRSDSSYLLVGGLGGLGRSLATWMVSRGARSLILLSRSGMHDIKANKFIQDLDVDIEVIKGDVCNMTDVQIALAAAKFPVRGIVQGALDLQDSLLDNMNVSAYRTTVLPRVLGTLNLHNASRDMTLDFFLMLSSWTRILGSASQSNYTASCAFMDAFAEYRQSQGLAAASLALSHIQDVGIVSEHLSYQENMVRIGLHGNGEKEFHHFCAIALTPSGQGHLLAGVDPQHLLDHNTQYPVTTMPWATDPRLAFLMLACQLKARKVEPTALPDKYADNLNESLEHRIQRQVARAVFISVDDIELALPITRYGVDSMAAANIRNWLSAALNVKISLLNLLHPTTTVNSLAVMAHAAKTEDRT